MRRKSTSNSSMKKHKAKPMIWDYFEMLPNSSQHGKCKTCKMNVSCKFNTGNFVRHMQLTHKDVYREVQLDSTPEYYACCLRDGMLKIERDLSKFS